MVLLVCILATTDAIIGKHKTSLYGDFKNKVGYTVRLFRVRNQTSICLLAPDEKTLSLCPIVCLQ